jgi:hypothetical protein
MGVVCGKSGKRKKRIHFSLFSTTKGGIMIILGIYGVRPVKVSGILACQRRFGMKAMLKETKRNCGIPPLLAAGAAALLMTAALAGCVNPAALPSVQQDAAEAASGGGQSAPYTVSVYLGGDEAPLPAEAGRSVAGPTKERIGLPGIRNYIQVIAVDKADGTVAGIAEARKTGPSLMSPPLTLRGLIYGHTYAILLLQGHWERDYAAETAGGNYAYTNNPPTLLSAGYQEVTFSGGGSTTISVWPIYVDTVFTTGAGGLSAEPAVNAGKPGAVRLPAGAWAANWKVLRGASGTASGLGDLVKAQKAAGFGGDSFIVRGKKAVVRADGYGETILDPALTGNTVTLPLADYTGLSQTGKAGAVNFALNFTPFNVTEGWAGYDGASVFDLESGPPVWVIRNGLNDTAQDDKTDFTNIGNKPAAESNRWDEEWSCGGVIDFPPDSVNGNGAVRFTVADPQSAAAGELVVSGGSYAEASVVFTASGFTGTAQAWYAAVPADAPAPAYAAYTPLGDAAPGYAAYTPQRDTALRTYTEEVTPPGTGGHDVYVVLVKDGKAGAAHKLGVSTGSLPASVAEVRDYLASLAANNDPRGGSADDPVPLPMKMHLQREWDGEGGGLHEGFIRNSWENLLAAIGAAGKYVALDLSRCTTGDPKFSLPFYFYGYDEGLLLDIGRDRVVSLILPPGAQEILERMPGSAGLGGLTSLRTISGSGVTTVGCGAFLESNALTTMDFPALTTIRGGAFEGCSALTAVNLPALISIGDNAFDGTGNRDLTITLGRNAPKVGLPSPYSNPRTVIIKRPANNTGYDAAWQEAFKKSLDKDAAITLRFQDLY